MVTALVHLATGMRAFVPSLGRECILTACGAVAYVVEFDKACAPHVGAQINDYARNVDTVTCPACRAHDRAARTERVTR